MFCAIFPGLKAWGEKKRLFIGEKFIQRKKIFSTPENCFERNENY